MRWLIASDIHGSARWCEALIGAFSRERADRLLLLGDLLYHGPRNDLPEGYDPKRVIALLSSIGDRILCVRGNCDTEVDQMVLPFPILAEYALLQVGERLVFVTHGHHFNADSLPPLRPGDILLQGHTHVPECREKAGVTVMNPGSAAIPKEGSPHGYMTLEDGLFVWKDMDGAERMRLDTNNENGR